MSTRDEQEMLQHFTERYQIELAPVVLDVERAVIGGDWGANGYTTMEQADELGRRLDLGPGDRLLDVGSGRGWPGLYLAARTGCQVALCDLPFAALQAAARRAHHESMGDRAWPVVGGASGLPFRRSVFDAIVHTDVLC